MGYENEIIEYLTDYASGGEEALQKMERIKHQGKHYGLIITDCSMPSLNGYDLTTKVRKFHFTHKLDQPYIVACTGHTEQGFIQKGWDNQMDEVLPKPARIEVVAEILKECLYFV